ncbi:sensor domain-containing diguanylate cyclase [Pseudanabaena yagii]|uniref:Diguanylate cyclase n=1 Tax=Pseudanabaena yagii GIHE-NHR1 TaxID=2722753 RepID=A0ABX1LT03_9CYAN|nr:GGDEF domain-containing protein [Pseudanabaena yagii]NMF59288.1 diguanylate cyclase [Pseudanabaena yagii GIHE-NHR1]
MAVKRQERQSRDCKIPLQWILLLPFAMQLIGTIALLTTLGNYYWTFLICGVMLLLSMAFGVFANRWIRQEIEHIEISLKASHKKYKTLFELLPIGISITDPEGNLIAGNLASEKILKVPNQELTSRTYDSPEWQIVRFDGSPMPSNEYASVRALAENREIDNVRMGLFDDHGNVRWLSVSAAPIHLEGYGVAIAYVDISVLKHTEEALRQSEARLQAFLDNAPTPIAIKDLEGTYLSVNQEFTYWMQTSYEAVIGKKDYDIFSHDSVKRVRDMELQAIFEGIAVSFEETVHLPNGQRTFIITKFPLMDVHDKPYAVAGIYLDISDRKQGEMELAYSRDLQAAIYNGSADAIFLVDPLSLLVFDCNQQAIIMFEADSKQELIGIEGRTLQKREFTDAEIDAITDDVETFGVWSREVEYITKKGRYFWGNLAVTRITVASQEINLVRVTDISDRKYAETVLKESEALFQRITTISPEVIYIVVRHGDGSINFEYVNAAIEELLGMSIEDFMSMPNIHRFIFHPDDFESFERELNHSMQTMDIFRHEWRIITSQKQVKWVKSQARPERRENGDIAWYGFAIDVSERKQTEIALASAESNLRNINQELERLINLDGLTQIANRRCFNDRILLEWQRLHRDHQPLSLLMFDVDYFKLYNDRYGHQMGDECLIKIAQTVDDLMRRPADLVARYGGEEFIIILPNTKAEGAIVVAELVHQAIQKLQIPHQDSTVSDIVTISMGIACDLPKLERSPYVLISQADHALYEAKQQGRNRSVLFVE